MPGLALLLLLFSFLPPIPASISPSSRSPPPVCNSTNSTSSTRFPQFSLYVLSMQWPFSVCLSDEEKPTACLNPPTTFTIRGLWPTADKLDSSPSCCSTSFSLNSIIDLTPALRRFWPDFTSADNDASQWRSAWLRHGSCSGLAQRAYFRKTLQLARRYAFVRALNAHGVAASTEKTHRYDIVRKALAEATGGFDVALRCSRRDKGVYLDAVQVCLEKKGFFTTNCPSTCLDGDVGCCLPDDKILIPYWHLDYSNPESNDITITPGEEPPDVRAFWVGQLAGIVVLGGGLAYWTFKQFFEAASRNGRAPRPNPGAYQRITASR